MFPMYDCPKCGVEIEDDSTFCKGCGVLLEIICSACDATNPASLKVCRSCGVELSVAPVNEETTVSSEPVTGLSDVGLEASVRNLPETPADLLALPKSGFWMRACAFGVDSLLIIPITILSGALLANFYPDCVKWPDIAWSYWGLLMIAIYSIPLITRNGGTPGMKFLGLRLIRKDGTRLDFAQASSRSLCWFIPFVGGIGIFAIAWNRNKQAWHDWIVGTYVVESSIGPLQKKLGIWLGVAGYICHVLTNLSP